MMKKNKNQKVKIIYKGLAMLLLAATLIVNEVSLFAMASEKKDTAAQAIW